MAHALIECENENNLYGADPKEDWYRYLFAQMDTDKFEDFFRNRLSVITFNYDRSFEHYLFQAIKSGIGHDKEDDKILEILANMPIIHVHGHLGALFGDGPKVRSYSADPSLENVKIAMDGIIIVSEADRLGPAFPEAQRVIVSSQYLLFLGFGYDKINVQRLYLERWHENWNERGGKINGTVVGFSGKEYQMRVQPLFSRFQNNFNRNDLHVRPFLRNNLDWLIT